MTPIALLLGVALLTAPPPEPLVTRLKSTLEPGRPAELRVQPGPLETEIVSVIDTEAYPGTGIRSVLWWKDTAWGARGDQDIASLVRKRGWLKKPPAADALVRLWIAAERDTVMAFDDATPTRRIERGALVLDFVALNPMDPRDRSRVRVTFRAKGPAVVTEVREAPPERAPPKDLAGAVATNDALVIIKALQALTPGDAARQLPVLAGLVTAEVETISAEAMARLPGTVAATDALRTVLATLPAPRRAALVELARAFHGDGFASRLQDR